MADVRTEAFVSDIKEKLFAGNEFVKTATSHDAHVKDKTVHIPQAGSIAAVSKNRSILPATVGQRTDDEVTYDLDEYTTDPILIPNIDEIQLSYSKRTSVMNQHIQKINDRIGLEYLYEAAATTTATSIVTTGSSVSNIAPPSGTGTRKSLKLINIGHARAKLDADDISPTEERYLILPSVVYWDLLNSEPTLLNRNYMPLISQANLTMGVVDKIYGFNIITRSFTVTYGAGTTTRNAIGAAAAATDEWGMPGWTTSAMVRALGSIDFFDQRKNPVYYGDVFSALVMFASKKSRTDVKGIVSIIQDS